MCRLLTESGSAIKEANVMSVQAGVWNLDGSQLDEEFLGGISKAIADYGPDGEFSHFSGSLGMIYRPFHTTAESRLECQPHHSARENILTWDGRLDNRNELMADLASDLGPNHTDVGIVAAAFDRWETECFSKLIGEWALSVWQPHRKRVVLARDYIGTRQLFYHRNSKRVLWCNQLAPLALSGSPLSLCEEYVAGFLGLYPDAHLTPYNEIRSVAPASFVCIGERDTFTRRYWTLSTQPTIRYCRDVDYEEHFRHLFRQAVRRRLRSDSPILADLSGGFDSSSMVCMADDIFAREGSEAPPVDTISLYDSKEPDEDDHDYFIAVEKQRGRQGFHADLGESDLAFSLEYPEFVATPGLGEREGLKTALRVILKESKYRVALSGAGGDEMLGQALDPRMQFSDLLLELRWRELNKQLIAWSLLIRRPWIQLLLQTFRLFLTAPLRARFTQHSKLEPWISRKFARRQKLAVRKLPASQESRHWRPSAEDSLESLAVLARQLTFRRPSALETRYPYLDQTLVEFLSAIPSSQLLRPGERRSLMRRSLVGILPPEILSRHTKAGAARSPVVTLENQWSTVETLLRSPITTRLGYFDREQFYAALALAKNGQVPLASVTLFRALSLEAWLRDVTARGLLAIESPESHVTSFGKLERGPCCTGRTRPSELTLLAKQVDTSTRRGGERT
jgi:asparagine synthase (glutamine-hydrolysing)